MPELEAIERADHPATISTLTADLAALGVGSGATVMVHTSLSRLGFVAGGAHAVVAALFAAVGPDGTLAMPTHSSHLGDPAEWGDPPVPESWWAEIRAETPAFDALLTPTRQMGAVVECFRHAPGVQRSNHPTVSVAAVGPNAAAVVESHEIADGMGEQSPLARLYELDAMVLLLGITHANNTSLHLAEHRASYPGKQMVTKHSPVMVDGERVWLGYEELDADADDFERIGEAFANTGDERSGKVGAGIGRLMRMRNVVDFGAAWMTTNRR